MSAKLPVFEARGAHISVGTNVLLRDVNFTIYEGERVAIVGHNGYFTTRISKPKISGCPAI